MIARSLPNGVTDTTLCLPAHWQPALFMGETEGLTEAEESLVQQIERDYGHCYDASFTPTYQHWHDARADGIPPTLCRTYRFVTHEDHVH